jgi:hypothetical protein
MSSERGTDSRIERYELEGRSGRGSDVSAVVLSIGENTLARALESVRAQRPPLYEVMIVRDVTPFYRAINLAASMVQTPFFVQVDCDMVLDPDCATRLRAEVTEDTGIVVGQLRDPLMGQVRGVKLFRAACFAVGGMPNTATMDTDFVKAIERRGWRTRYILDTNDDTGIRHPSLGEHRPAYTPFYTFHKYRLEGRRHRSRGRPEGLRWHFEVLEQSTHPCALVAQLALAHGLFWDVDEDMLRPYGPDAEFDRVAAFLPDLQPLHVSVPPPPAVLDGTPAEVFGRFHRLGSKLHRERAADEFRAHMATLRAGRRDERQRLAKIALCHGLFSDAIDEPRMQADLDLLRGLLSIVAGETG